MKKFLLVLVMILTVSVTNYAYAGATKGPDPAGTATGNVNDITAVNQGKPTMTELADQVGHNKVAINMVWVLITGFLVMFMQAGFAMVETGLTRAKNANHTMAMNFMVYALGMLGFFISGFALMFGGVGSLATSVVTVGIPSRKGVKIMRIFQKMKIGSFLIVPAILYFLLSKNLY